MFTQFNDYQRLISDENLNVIIDDNSKLFRQMELTAQEEIESYLRHHFDVGLLFKGWTLWSATVAHVVGDLITFIDDTNAATEESDLYFCIDDTAAGESPLTDPAKWTKGDNRHQYLLTIFVDVTLYHAHSRINPRNIPEFRIQRYDDAIMWLKKVNSGKVTPDFPIKDPVIVEGRNIHFGQTKVENNTY